MIINMLNESKLLTFQQPPIVQTQEKIYHLLFIVIPNFIQIQPAANLSCSLRARRKYSGVEKQRFFLWSSKLLRNWRFKEDSMIEHHFSQDQCIVNKYIYTNIDSKKSTKCT